LELYVGFYFGLYSIRQYSNSSGIIKEYIDKTLEMVKKILVRNSLKPSDIQFTLLVGGSTYIPYVRKRVEEILQIPINCDIDPTTAIAIGAAYYAGTKEKNFEQEKSQKLLSGIRVRLAYQKTSQENEEILAGKVEGSFEGLFYRITRDDKGFDTGLKKLTTRISEDLPLVKNSYNFFRFAILDNLNNAIEADVELIGIAQGKYNVAGQPLSYDICLEKDSDFDVEGKSTMLDLFFQKGTILPQKRTKIYTLGKTIIKDSTDKFIVNVLEGPSTSLAVANKTLGYIEITGKQVVCDIFRGTEIEITLEMSESQDIKATIYISRSDQQFSEIFNSSKRNLSVTKLKEDTVELSNTLEYEIKEAVQREEYEIADQLTSLKKRIGELVNNSNKLTEDDVTDKKFQFEDNKRKIAQEIDDATRDKRISILKIKYNEDKEWCKKIVDENGNDHDHKNFNEIIGKEIVFLNSITPVKILEAINELISLGSTILWRTPVFLEGRFRRLIEKPQLFNDQEQAKSLMEAGHLAITNKNFDRLREVNFGLINLLPKNIQESEEDGKINLRS
jgi:molecular chaperone DnaK